MVYVSKTTPLERFERHVERTLTCWLWTGSLTEHGYGHFGPVRGTTVKAHRFAYQQFVGPIPDDLPLDHLCRVRRCVNPAHLEPVTQRENLLRGDTSTAAFAAQTHCMRGHPLSGDNLYRPPNASNQRHCRACRRMAKRQSRARMALLAR